MPFAAGGGVRRQSLRAAAVVAVTLVAGCNDRHHVTQATWTLFDIQRALHAWTNVGMGPTLPAGMPATAILAAQADGTDTLNVVPAFSESAPAAFVTTELWINYQQVWLQPGYVQVGGDPPARLFSPEGASPLLIDVGPSSTFYSPFWQLELANVGTLDRFHSTRDLLDAGVSFSPTDPHACPARPLGANEVHAAPAGEHMHEPTWDTELDVLPEGSAWLNGQQVGLFDFGAHVFSADADKVIQPLPFFLFVGPDASGAVGPLPMAWRVAGVGPVGSGRTADVGHDENGWPQPHFGAFWRVYLALVPSGGGAFDIGEHPATTPPGVDLKEYQGRVALDVRCFDAADFPAGCTWLDSQAHIEASLPPANLIPTEIMGTCPLVFFEKKPVRIRP